MNISKSTLPLPLIKVKPDISKGYDMICMMEREKQRRLCSDPTHHEEFNPHVKRNEERKPPTNSGSLTDHDV